MSSVGRSLGHEVSKRLLALHPDLADTHLTEIGTIVSAACLAHDLGNPPFGHSGERAISTYFSERAGQTLQGQLTEPQWCDLTHFEGNANAFRLLTHQFKGRREGGFVMTYSTLASIVKYPYASTAAGSKPKFGFFVTEEEDFRRIATDLGMTRLQESPLRYARHPLVYLVEAADDICYQLMDLEDAHKLKLLTTDETKDLLLGYLDEHRRERAADIFRMVTDRNEQVAYLRSTVIGLLIHECAEAFVAHEAEILAGTFEGALIRHIHPVPRQAYARSAELSMQRIYRSKDVLDIELAGFRVISTLVDLFIEAVSSPQKAYSQLLISRMSEQYDVAAPTLFGKVQAVLDYISGMTDVYALDLYRKINGNSLPAV